MNTKGKRVNTGVCAGTIIIISKIKDSKALPHLGIPASFLIIFETFNEAYNKLVLAAVQPEIFSSSFDPERRWKRRDEEM